MLDDPPRSWRVDTIRADVCGIALFIRDAAGLDIGPNDVPRLSKVSVVPVSGDLLVAARQWTSWWQQVLELEFSDRAAPTPGRNRAQYLIARREAVCDPPNFAALADRPELQAAARQTSDAYQQWRGAVPTSGGEFDWAVVRQTAEDVAFDHRVSLDRVQARVGVVPVDGVWWTRVAPGGVLCSLAAARDPVAVQTLLRDAFVSGLAP